MNTDIYNCTTVKIRNIFLPRNCSQFLNSLIERKEHWTEINVQMGGSVFSIAYLFIYLN